MVAGWPIDAYPSLVLLSLSFFTGRPSQGGVRWLDTQYKSSACEAVPHTQAATPWRERPQRTH